MKQDMTDGVCESLLVELIGTPVIHHGVYAAATSVAYIALAR